MADAQRAPGPRLRYRAGAEDTRDRILEMSERLFRELGYRKTTIADIADGLGMSPGNVYRFFPSKSAINEAVAERVLGEISDTLAAWPERTEIAPAARLHGFLIELAELSTARFMGNRRVYDMVEVAMAENWEVCLAYKDRLAALITAILSDGQAQARGAFRIGDPATAAASVCSAMLRFSHPKMMAEFADSDDLGVADMVAFILAGLGATDAAQEAPRRDP